jgi:transposase-like protein
VPINLTKNWLRYSPEQRQTLLGAFDRGGQSALAFSRSHGVSYQTFIAWLRKRRVGGGSLPPGVSPFAEVILEQAPPSSSSARRILLPCGTVIEVASRAALPLAAELLSTLRRPC